MSRSCGDPRVRRNIVRSVVMCVAHLPHLDYPIAIDGFVLKVKTRSRDTKQYSRGPLTRTVNFGFTQVQFLAWWAETHSVPVRHPFKVRRAFKFLMCIAWCLAG